MRLFVNNLQRQKTVCFIYVVWWFFETNSFCALPKKAKISKLQRLKIGLGMSNIEFK